MAQATIITIERPGGQIETVRKLGAIDAATQAKMIEATRAAGRGEIVSFVIEAAQMRTSKPTTSNGLYTRGQARCKGCGRIGDDGECGLGDY